MLEEDIGMRNSRRWRSDSPSGGACFGFGFFTVGSSSGQPYCPILIRKTHGKVPGSTYACLEGVLVEGALALEPRLLVRHAIADVLVDRRRRALERADAVELGDRLRVAHPSQKLLVGHDPDCTAYEPGSTAWYYSRTIILLLSPVEEGVDHVDYALRRLDTGVVGCDMDRVRVQANRLPVVLVVGRERVLHVLERRLVIDLRIAVGGLEPGVHQMRPRRPTVVEERVHRDLPEAGELGLALAKTIDREAVVRHAIVEGVRPERVGALVRDRNGGRGTGVIRERGVGEMFERVDRELEIRRPEACHALEKCVV